MMFSYVKAIPGQVRYPFKQIFEIHIVCHDRQNLPSGAPVIHIVITFGKTFRQ